MGVGDISLMCLFIEKGREINGMFDKNEKNDIKQKNSNSHLLYFTLIFLKNILLSFLFSSFKSNTSYKIEIFF